MPLDEPIVVADIASAKWLTPEHKAAHASEGTRSMIAVPLHHRGDVIGTLVFYSHRRRAFSAEEVRAAGAVAGLAAAAIGTASVYQKQAKLAETRKLLAEASDVHSRRRSTTRPRWRTSPRSSCRSSPTGASSTSSARTARSSASPSHTQDPVQGRAGEALIAKLPVDPDSGARRPGRDPNAASGGAAGDRRTRVEETYRDRPALLEELRELGLQSSMIVPLVARRRALGAITFVAAESRTDVRRGRSRRCARPRPPRRDRGRQRDPVSRGAAEGEPGALPRGGRQRPQRRARLRRDARRARAPRRPADRGLVHRRRRRRRRDPARRGRGRRRGQAACARGVARALSADLGLAPAGGARAARGRTSDLRGVHRRQPRRHDRRRGPPPDHARSSIRTPPSRCRSSRAARRWARSRSRGRRPAATTASATCR